MALVLGRLVLQHPMDFPLNVHHPQVLVQRKLHNLAEHLALAESPECEVGQEKPLPISTAATCPSWKMLTHHRLGLD
jgi:hypothetical protein